MDDDGGKVRLDVEFDDGGGLCLRRISSDVCRLLPPPISLEDVTARNPNLLNRSIRSFDAATAAEVISALDGGLLLSDGSSSLGTVRNPFVISPALADMAINSALTEAYVSAGILTLLEECVFVSSTEESPDNVLPLKSTLSQLILPNSSNAPLGT